MSKDTGAPRLLPLVPLRNMVMLPGVATTILVGRPRSLAAVEAALEGDRALFLTAQHDASVQEPAPEDMYDVGVVCAITGTKEEIYREVERFITHLGRFNGGLVGYIEEYHSVGMSDENYTYCINAFRELGVY